jgi:hypothetical protein
MKAPCSINGCGRPVLARGFCNAHYLRQKRKYPERMNDPLRTPYGEPKRWILDHVEHRGDDCLIWPFARLPSGYGTIEWGGKTVTAHRQMCKLAHGEPPTTKHQSAHSCGNGFGGCVHPQHLRWATSSENQMDKLAHGKDTRGERNAAHKLTVADVLYIRKTYRPGVVTLKSLADKFGLNKTCVHKIVKGESWAWLK